MASPAEHRSDPIRLLSPGEHEALDRLLASELFTAAPRVHALLRYFVDALKSGSAADVNEARIGEIVFERRTGFNPAEDNIVRVTVRNLRTRLDQYYASEGRDDQWVLEVPRGKYVPVLRPREVAVETVHPVTAAKPGRWIWYAAAALLVGNIVLGVLLWRDKTAVAEVPRQAGLLQALLAEYHGPVVITLPDSNLRAYREAFGKFVSLNSYIKREHLNGKNFPDDAMPSGAKAFMTGGSDTSVTASAVASRIQSALYPLPVSMRHPKDGGLRDFRKDTHILLGGPWVNPWAQLFEPRLNYRIEPVPPNAQWAQIVNTDPKGSEPQHFPPHADGSLWISYCRIAVLPNLTGTGRVIMLGSNSAESLEAAGDFLTKPAGLKQVQDLFHVKDVGQMPDFEVVLEISGMSGTPDSTKVVAHRTISQKP